MEQKASLSGECSSWGCQFPQPCQGPGETPPAPVPAPAIAPVEAEKQVEAASASLCCAGSGGNASSMEPSSPPSCSLQDLPPELLVEIFSSLHGTDLPSVAQACTQFRSILHIDSIWRRRCREEFGVCANLQDLVRMGLSCRQFYTNLLHPYRNILGLWRVIARDRIDLVKVAVDGLCITGWRYMPAPSYLNVEVPMQWKHSFRIRLTSTAAKVECVEDSCGSVKCCYRRPHLCHLMIQKDRFTLKHVSIQNYFPNYVSYRNPDCPTYTRVYLPPSHPDDLIRPGIFQGRYDDYSLKIALLSFNGRYARATKIAGDPAILSWREMLEIHLMLPIQLPNMEILPNLDELSRIVWEVHEQVVPGRHREEEGPEDSQGHGWQSPAQPSLRESRPAALGEQPAHSFVLPAGVESRAPNYPGTYRMCFYGEHIVHYPNSFYVQHFPGIFILFDENHFGFLCVEQECFTLYSRIQDTFKHVHVEAPSPQALLEMLQSIQVLPGEEQFDFHFED